MLSFALKTIWRLLIVPRQFDEELKTLEELGVTISIQKRFYLIYLTDENLVLNCSEINKIFLNPIQIHFLYLGKKYFGSYKFERYGFVLNCWWKHVIKIYLGMMFPSVEDKIL
jgi:hypothetical protein